MEIRFFNLLPECGKRFVNEIEAFGNKPIEIIADPLAKKPSCRVTPTVAQIVFPDLGKIKADEMLHEVLHIYRNWPKQIPILLPRKRDDPALINIYGRLDNQLEHLVIVPLQAQAGHSVTDSWASRLREEWKSRFWERAQDKRDARATLLIDFLSIAIIVNEPVLTEYAKAELSKLKLLEDAEKLHAKALRVIDDKSRLSAAALRFIGQQRDEWCLIRLDVQSGQEIVTDIPLH